MATETPREIYRRQRRAVALSALQHLATVALSHYPNDRPSQEDLIAAHKLVYHTLEAFEGEANDAERTISDAANRG